MQRKNDQLKKLYDKINSGQANQDEKDLLARWIAQLDIGKNEPSFKKIEAQRRRLLVETMPRDTVRKASKRLRIWSLSAAAALVIAIMTLAIHQFAMKSDNEILVRQQDNILPGSDKAVLTLADGSTISLTDVANGEILEEEGIQVEKTEEGEIVYRTNNLANAPAEAYNRVVTPNGGQYRIMLPDGSKAWLNAASSLTYPVNFSRKERRVKMTGEIYFEVAKVTDERNVRVPFFVETEKQEVQVLGTKFNVNAYLDEPVLQTTLVEGSVRVNATESGKSVVLKPGQFAILSDNLEVHNADIQQQLAWKNGDFVFQSEELQSILRKVARWYDIDVFCPVHLGKVRFDGMVSRKQPLSTIIDMLKITGKVNVQIKERRLIVTD
ncbi:FecR family protein [Sphingobacterium arenae]|uniref:FecR family protein n=1 Tax=Sphingobacterium arenae TaxID=1280598 RepID=A0ABR7Y3B8_9SPHI|nr:FecR family protein [Sphingobacterium arenae]MBD1425796.1 FecR family protein [Sphingobacterium arenae]